LTAQYKDSRLYKASRDRIFQACRDAVQLCGFSITSSDSGAFKVEAMAPYRADPDAGFAEEISAFAVEKLFTNRVGEKITLNVDENGCVHAASVSRPKTTLFDQGKNRRHILSLWVKMDEYLLHSPTVVNDNSVTIGSNSGIVQNGSIGDLRQTNNFAARDPYSSDTVQSRRGEDGEWDVGVITVLSEETRAVLFALGLQGRRIDGLHFYEGEADSDSSGTSLKVVATRALEQGNRSVMAACENLRRHYAPRVIVLVGIGGAIHPDVAVGDVVVADRVVYYDLRKETPEGTRRRGEEHVAPARTRHAVNAFFTEHDPAQFEIADPADIVHDMRMWKGGIGSGDAVIADHDAEILKFLAGYNDKILAVDMEAGGLAAACHEQSAASGQLHGWIVIRGISDDAGAGKNDDHHRLASWHAAVALRKILPYLAPGPS
jgi:adenosylhomocysteine nucleosidase